MPSRRRRRSSWLRSRSMASRRSRSSVFLRPSAAAAVSFGSAARSCCTGAVESLRGRRPGDRRSASDDGSAAMPAHRQSRSTETAASLYSARPGTGRPRTEASASASRHGFDHVRRRNGNIFVTEQASSARHPSCAERRVLLPQQFVPALANRRPRHSRIDTTVARTTTVSRPPRFLTFGRPFNKASSDFALGISARAGVCQAPHTTAMFANPSALAARMHFRM